MTAVTSSAVSSTVGERPKKRKFKLNFGGTIMATRGKRKMSRGKTMSRGKKKNKKR